MSDRGVFAVARGVFDHPLFADEPFSEREAWLWLVSEAVWKPRRVRVRNGTVDLQRGQLAYATRFLATKWKWSEARVRRFLSRLKSDAMIDAHSDARATLITICKYDEYQRVSLPRDAQSDAVDDADSTRTRRKEEDIEDIETVYLNARGASEPMARLEFDHTFWPAYPNKEGRPSALRAFIKARRTTPLAEIMDGLARYVASKPNHREWLKPANFLDDERWNDEPAPVDSRQSNGRAEPVHDPIFRALARRASDSDWDGERQAGPDVRLLDH